MVGVSRADILINQLVLLYGSGFAQLNCGDLWKKFGIILNSVLRNNLVAFLS